MREPESTSQKAGGSHQEPATSPTRAKAEAACIFAAKDPALPDVSHNETSGSEYVGLRGAEVNRDTVSGPVLVRKLQSQSLGDFDPYRMVPCGPRIGGGTGKGPKLEALGIDLGKIS
jgi:hypothetical protein